LVTTTSAPKAIGTLIQKIHRQPASPRMRSAPAKKPPTTGPTTLAVPKTARK
jgi:hypothetical protein